MNSSEEKKWLIIDLKKCIVCNICESICSLVHQNNRESTISNGERIKINPIFENNNSCLICEELFCISACHSKALDIVPKTKIIIYNGSKCDGCGICIKSCPFGAINIQIEEKKIIQCDMCENTRYNTPQCVEFCPKDAIIIDKEDKSSLEDTQAVLRLFTNIKIS